MAPDCYNCKHKLELNGINPVCLAFKEKIPDIIFFGRIKHTKPLKAQKNDIVFEPVIG
jgi:hypothetical protein